MSGKWYIVMFIKPQISVILSTYARNHAFGDCPNLLKRAIDSILTQEFFEFELLIFDDASKDGTEEVLKQYAFEDPRVKVFRHEKNSGCHIIRYNEGIAKAKGKYIAFMFDDDLWYPNALRELYHAIEQSKFYAGMVYGQVKYVNGKNGTVFAEKFGSAWNGKLIKKSNFLANNSVLIKKEVFDLIGGYDEAKVINRLCDHELWIRISTCYTANLVPVIIGEVHGFLPDSLGIMVSLDENAIQAHLKKRKHIPLKKKTTLSSLAKKSVNKSCIFLKRVKALFS